MIYRVHHNEVNSEVIEFYSARSLKELGDKIIEYYHAKHATIHFKPNPTKDNFYEYSIDISLDSFFKNDDGSLAEGSLTLANQYKGTIELMNDIESKCI